MYRYILDRFLRTIGLCVCLLNIWWYILDRQGKLIRKGKLV